MQTNYSEYLKKYINVPGEIYTRDGVVWWSYSSSGSDRIVGVGLDYVVVVQGHFIWSVPIGKFLIVFPEGQANALLPKLPRRKAVKKRKQ